MKNFFSFLFFFCLTLCMIVIAEMIRYNKL